LTHQEIYKTLAQVSAKSRDKTMLSVAIDRIIELNERINVLEEKLHDPQPAGVAETS